MLAVAASVSLALGRSGAALIPRTTWESRQAAVTARDWR